MSLLVFFSFPLESFTIFFSSISSLISSRAPFGPHPLLSKNLETSYAGITRLWYRKICSKEVSFETFHQVRQKPNLFTSDFTAPRNTL